MTPADLAKFEAQRRYATLVALAIRPRRSALKSILSDAS